MFELPEDPYRVLGVPKDADSSTIKKEYRKLILKCHPDKVPEDLKEKKQEEFQRVQSAYELLNNDQRRSEYDEKLKFNEKERDVARQRAAQAAAAASRTPPRHDGFRHVDARTAAEPLYRNVEPSFKKSHSFPAEAFYSHARTTPPHSWEDINGHTSYDEARSSRRRADDREARHARRDEERRSRRTEDEEWERQREKAARKREARAAVEEQEQKDRERREKERRKEEKERKREKRDKETTKERRKDVESKRARQYSAPYVEEDTVYPDPEFVSDPYTKQEPFIQVVDVEPNTPPHKSEKKSKSSRSTKHDIPIRELPRSDDVLSKKVFDHMEYAAQYLETSRSKNKGGPSLNRAHTYHPTYGVYPPPAVATPPPATAGMGVPPPVRDIHVEEEPVRRSSARPSRRMSNETPRSSRDKSSHKKSGSRDEEESARPIPTVPSLKKSNTMPTQHNSPPAVPESPPRVSRSKTDTYSRPPPVANLNRAHTWFGDETQDRSHSRQPRYEVVEESDDDKERHHRRSRKTRSPEPASRGQHSYSYTVNKDTNRTNRYAEESRKAAKAQYAYQETANTGRPMMRDETYGGASAFGFKVRQGKEYDYNDVSYGNVSHTPYAAPAEYGYANA